MRAGQLDLSPILRHAGPRSGIQQASVREPEDHCTVHTKESPAPADAGAAGPRGLRRRFACLDQGRHDGGEMCGTLTSPLARVRCRHRRQRGVNVRLARGERLPPSVTYGDISPARGETRREPRVSSGLETPPQGERSSVPSSVASVEEEDAEQRALDAQLLFQGADRALVVLDVALDRLDLGQMLANGGIRLPDLRPALPFEPLEFPFEVRQVLPGVVQALLVPGRLLRLPGLGLGFRLGLFLCSLLGPPFRATLLERLFRLLGRIRLDFAQRWTAAFTRHCGGGKLNAGNGDGKSESGLCNSPGDHGISPSSFPM